MILRTTTEILSYRTTITSVILQSAWFFPNIVSDDVLWSSENSFPARLTNRSTESALWFTSPSDFLLASSLASDDNYHQESYISETAFLSYWVQSDLGWYNLLAFAPDPPYFYGEEMCVFRLWRSQRGSLL